ncbi:MAG: hypothetical protein Q4A93_03300 [Actinomycetota bacterium]|nr:hypothetical protein [Actinomycetota bacterium]
MSEAKMTELTQAEDMAYFRADLCLYSPESYTLEEKKQICNDMMATSKAVLDATRGLPADAVRGPQQAPGHALPVRSREPAVVVGRPRGRWKPALPRAGAAAAGRRGWPEG